MTNVFDPSLQANLRELVFQRTKHISQSWLSSHKLKREDWERMFSPNHETLRAIREFLEAHGHEVNLTLRELIGSQAILVDVELLRVCVEQGADPSLFDQRMFWPRQRIGRFPNPNKQFFYFAQVLRACFVQYGLSQGESPTLAVDESLLRQVLESFGEISPYLVFRKQSLVLTSVNKHMFDVLAALAKLDLANASFFACFEKQLLPLRGAENYFISLLRCGKWHRTEREILILAARYGHLRLLRELLDDRGDDDDLVRLALFNSDCVDVLQLLVSEYNADVNTFNDQGNTVLHSLCRSAAAHAEDALSWLFTSTDFVLVDLEHCEDGTALDVVCAHLNFPLMELLLHYGYGYSLPLTKREIERCALFGMPLIGYVCARTQIPTSAALLCVEEFIRRGARLDTRDMRGDTPVTLSSRCKNLKLMSQLMRNYPDSV